MFQDEARFGRISDCRRCWCPYPVRPIVKAMHIREYTYAFAAASPIDGRMDSLILPSANGECMQIFLNEIELRYPNENIVMVVDGASWHRSGSINTPRNIQLLELPPYSPELNPVEHLWEELREKNFHNRTFASLQAVETHLAMALTSLENNPALVASITAWDWIINAVSNEK
jgi:transposase